MIDGESAVSEVTLFTTFPHLEILFCENYDYKEEFFFILWDMADIQGMGAKSNDNMGIKNVFPLFRYEHITSCE